MIITRTPYRISFAGGGTDYPAWFKKHGGAVLSTTIDKYCYISARWLLPFYGVRHQVMWTHREAVNSVSEILHPCVQAALQYLDFNGDGYGVEIHHQGDLPARAGMGTSSSFTVGLLRALTMLRQEKNITSRQLADMAITLEQDVLADVVGCQDQIAAAFGGFNIIRFERDGNYTVYPIFIGRKTKRELQKRLMLFYTGTTRLASEIAATVVENFHDKVSILQKMHEYVDDAYACLKMNQLDSFGELMHKNWLLKRQQSLLISNDRIDGIYQKAIDAGALGGKLLGAGLSGFMLFYVNLEHQEKVKKALVGLVHVPFKFEKEGCKVIYECES